MFSISGLPYKKERNEKEKQKRKKRKGKAKKKETKITNVFLPSLPLSRWLQLLPTTKRRVYQWKLALSFVEIYDIEIKVSYS
jgi:hypothetical protein